MCVKNGYWWKNLQKFKIEISTIKSRVFVKALSDNKPAETVTDYYAFIPTIFVVSGFVSVQADMHCNGLSPNSRSKITAIDTFSALLEP